MLAGASFCLHLPFFNSSHLYKGWSIRPIGQIALLLNLFQILNNLVCALLLLGKTSLWCQALVPTRNMLLSTLTRPSTTFLLKCSDISFIRPVRFPVLSMKTEKRAENWALGYSNIQMSGEEKDQIRKPRSDQQDRKKTNGSNAADESINMTQSIRMQTVGTVRILCEKQIFSP